MMISAKFSTEDQFRGFLSTPKIFAENALFEYPAFRLKYLNEANSIRNLPEPEGSVLGKCMEDFFATYIMHFSSEEILLRNQQIIFEKETLGELDFLLKDPFSEEVTHVELVYKFYLYDSDSGKSEIEHLIGPNKRDSLMKKLMRLQKRQFPLLFHPVTQALLATKGISAEEVHQKVCFKANIFLPKQIKEIKFSEINPDAVAGCWIKASEFNFETYGKNAFFTPVKKYWPVLPQHNTSWLTFKEIAPQINELLKKHFSPLVWMKAADGRISRFFVVWW